MEEHLSNQDINDGILALVTIDLTKISGKSKRIDITLPERFIRQIDIYSKYYGGNRSAFIATATMNFIAEHKVSR